MKVAQLSPTLCDPMDYTVHGILQPEGNSFPSLGDLPNPGSKPRYPVLQVDSLPAELQGKPKNSGVGSLSLFQQIFPTQESNQGFLHCRWILYQLSYQESPPTPVFLPKRSQGQRNQVGYSPQGCKELDTTERLSLHFTSFYLKFFSHLGYY